MSGIAAARADAPDPTAFVLAEPQRSVGTRDDPFRTHGPVQRIDMGRAAGSDPPDRVVDRSERVEPEREPQSAVGAWGDVARAPGTIDRELPHVVSAGNHSDV